MVLYTASQPANNISSPVAIKGTGAELPVEHITYRLAERQDGCFDGRKLNDQAVSYHNWHVADWFGEHWSWQCFDSGFEDADRRLP